MQALLTSCCLASGVSSFTCLVGLGRGEKERLEGVEDSMEELVNILFLVPPLNIAFSKCVS